ncbi:MAG: cache domain-containing protein [Candidatus Omnitrophica bacterium]|nr:cache domain-containing protein [Candidatus Omnitrophota bacterium]
MRTLGKFSIITLLPFCFLLLASCARIDDRPDLSMYQYTDTRNLVMFVYDAARKVEKRGLSQIEDFKRNRSLYRKENYYLYVYKTSGDNLFHAGVGDIEGKNLLDITDVNGKQITRLVIESLENKNNPHGWVHYSWWEPGKFYPVPKSSCHFKVSTPEGAELFVGAGMDYPHEEKEFIRIAVDSAADLIERDGEKAFHEIADPKSQYIYRDVKVFVFDSKGGTIISPVIKNSPLEINFIESYDDAGHQPFKRAMEEIKNQDTSWQVFMERSRERRSLIKKVLYLRKMQHRGETIYVGAITNLPQPATAD